MSKSLRASAILIAISVGVPSAALATMDGTPEPSSTYTLTVPASDVGDDGSDVPLCFASLGLTDGSQPDGQGVEIREGSATSTEFRTADLDPDLANRLEYDDYGEIWDDYDLLLTAETTLGEWSDEGYFGDRIDSGDPLYRTEIFSWDDYYDGYSIHSFFRENDDSGRYGHLDRNDDGFIDRDDASILNFDREIFRTDPLVADWEASNCDDGLSGLLTVERGFVQMVGADGIQQDAETAQIQSLLVNLLNVTKQTASAGPYSDYEDRGSDEIACYSYPNFAEALAIGQSGSEELSPYIKIYDRDRASSYSVGLDFSLVTGIEDDLYADYGDNMYCLEYYGRYP